MPRTLTLTATADPSVWRIRYGRTVLGLLVQPIALGNMGITPTHAEILSAAQEIAQERGYSLSAQTPIEIRQRETDHA